MAVKFFFWDEATLGSFICFVKFPDDQTGGWTELTEDGYKSFWMCSSHCGIILFWINISCVDYSGL